MVNGLPALREMTKRNYFFQNSPESGERQCLNTRIPGRFQTAYPVKCGIQREGAKKIILN